MHGLYGKELVKHLETPLKFHVMLHINGVMTEKLLKLGFSVINLIT